MQRERKEDAEKEEERKVGRAGTSVKERKE